MFQFPMPEIEQPICYNSFNSDIVNSPINGSDIKSWTTTTDNTSGSVWLPWHDFPTTAPSTIYPQIEIVPIDPTTIVITNPLEFQIKIKKKRNRRSKPKREWRMIRRPHPDEE